MRSNRMFNIQVVLQLVFGFLIGSAIMAQDLAVTITSPNSGAKFIDCTDIDFEADVQITEGTIKDVRFYRNNTFFGRARSEPWAFTWKEVPDGIYFVHARVVTSVPDTAYSDSIAIVVGDVNDGTLISNGHFTCNLTPWRLNVSGANGAAATAWIEPDVDLWEGPAVMVDITAGGSADWHVQLMQNMPLIAGHAYSISFFADAMDTHPASFMLQLNADPYTVYYQENFTIADMDVEFGPFEYIPDQDYPSTNFIFNLGNTVGTVMIDAVEIIDPEVTSVKESGKKVSAANPSTLLLSQNFPNPFNSSTRIQYTLPEDAETYLRILNIQGQVVRTLLQQEQTPGVYHVTWDGRNNQGQSLPSGLYFYEIRAYGDSRLYSTAQKMLLVE